jgi:hypothetical protein
MMHFEAYSENYFAGQQPCKIPISSNSGKWVTKLVSICRTADPKSLAVQQSQSSQFYLVLTEKMSVHTSTKAQGERQELVDTRAFSIHAEHCRSMITGF